MSNKQFTRAVGRILRFIKDMPVGYHLYREYTEYSFLKRRREAENIFDDIYLKNGWNNKESISGIGSIKAHTHEVIRVLPMLCEKYQVRTFLDAPCGDFNWMQHVLFSPDMSYVGGDIVEALVHKNNLTYGTDKRSFVHLDILVDELGKADVIFVRDCLVHLSYTDIRNFLRNLVRSEITYLVTTTFPQTRNNYDITTGNWRPINLQRKPFEFPEPIEIINEKTTENKCQYADKSLNMYRVCDLKGLDFTLND